MTQTFDRDQAISKFVERRTLNEGTRVDNSEAFAGSPMVYHCKHCEAHTETLPEDHRQKPVTVCAPCRELVENGCMEDATRSHPLVAGDQAEDLATLQRQLSEPDK
jgi:hypothetical protein